MCVAVTQQDALCTFAQVAAIGFCMGAALAIAASQYGKIHATVGCYGLPQYDICPVSSLTHALPDYAVLYRLKHVHHQVCLMVSSHWCTC